MPANNSDAFVDGLGPAGSAYGANAFTAGVAAAQDTDSIAFLAGYEITETATLSVNEALIVEIA